MLQITSGYSIKRRKTGYLFSIIKREPMTNEEMMREKQKYKNNWNKVQAHKKQ